MYYDLKSASFAEEEKNASLNFLYNTAIGRCILKIAVTKPITKIYAQYMNSSLSKGKIAGFIKKNGIDLSEYKEKEYASFNDFFIREIKPEKRPIEDGLIAVCDSKLSVYEIDENSRFNIKNSVYTIKELIGENREYKYALIFRLCVDDYHHYIVPDKCRVKRRRHIDGILHTVQPIAFKKYKVFHENSREITFLSCENLGDVSYIEVGALMVGKIVNDNKDAFEKGEEKGHFEFGGSTVILLINKDIAIDGKIMENSKNDIETIVKMGQNIGEI